MSGPAVDRIATGIPDLDPILEGGFLKGGVYLVQGPPGSGKTVFGNQLCYLHAKSGGQAVFLTLLAESHTRMLAHMRRMAFFDPALVPDRIFYVSGLKILETDGLPGLVRSLRETIASRGASLVVIDGFVSAEEAAPTPKQLKKFIHEVQSITAMTGSTALLLSSTERSSVIRPEHTMVDGIIELSDDLARRGPLRQMRVRKMRGTDQIRGQHTVEITNAGIVIHPRLEVQLSRPAGADEVTPGHARMAIGIAGLDEMLRGGLPENSKTMLLGPTGTGKTILGMQFLAEGARRGDRGVLFGFYERPEALRLKSDRLNLGFTEMVDEGLIEVVWQPLVENVIDILGERLFAAIKRTRARRLFIDSLQGFQLALDDYPERIRGVFSAIADELERMGVTCVYTIENREIFGPIVEMPVPGISSIAHNLLLFRYLELNSRLHRLLSIVKVRDSDYDSTVRELRITDRGIELDRVFPGAEAPVVGTGMTSGAVKDAPGEGRGKKTKNKAKASAKDAARHKRKA